MTDVTDSVQRDLDALKAQSKINELFQKYLDDTPDVLAWMAISCVLPPEKLLLSGIAARRAGFACPPGMTMDGRRQFTEVRHGR